MSGSMSMLCGMLAFVGTLVANGAAAQDTPVPATAIEGPEWRLTSLRGIDAETLGAVRETVHVRFAQGRVQGFGGCNRLAGGYTIDGDRLTLSPMAGTMMACPPPAMGIETAFHKAFSGTLRVRLGDGVLSLTPAAESVPTLVFAAAPPPRLDGIAWQVTGYNNGRQAAVSPKVDTHITVSFADGAASGSAGCNTFRAGYTVNGDRIAIGAPATTRKHCGDEVMAQEREFLAALQSATTWTIDGGMLDMHRADGERVLHAKP